MSEIRPFLVNGEWRTGEGTFEVKSPFDDSVVAELGVPTAADVEEASQAAADTFQEAYRLPVHVRAEALDHISRRLAEDIDENAQLIARRGRQAAEVGDGRGHARRRRRSAGPPRCCVTATTKRCGSTPRPRSRVAHRDPAPVPDRSRARHHAVQLPAEPGGAQGRALARRRGADRREARERHADRVARAGRVLRRDRPAQGHVPGAAGELEGRRRYGPRRAVPEDQLHGLGGDRLVPEGRSTRRSA